MIEYDLWPWKHEIGRFPGALRLCLPWSEREKTLSFFVSELRQPQRMQSTGALRAAQLLSFTGRQRYTSPRRNGPGGCQWYTVRQCIGFLRDWSIGQLVKSIFVNPSRCKSSGIFTKSQLDGLELEILSFCGKDTVLAFTARSPLHTHKVGHVTWQKLRTVLKS